RGPGGSGRPGRGRFRGSALRQRARRRGAPAPAIVRRGRRVSRGGNPAGTLPARGAASCAHRSGARRGPLRPRAAARHTAEAVLTSPTMATQPTGGPADFTLPDALPVLPLPDGVVFPLTAVPPLVG